MTSNFYNYKCWLTISKDVRYEIPMIIVFAQHSVLYEYELHLSAQLRQYCIVKILSANDGAAFYQSHYSDVIIKAMTSQITHVTIVYLTACADADQRKYQSSASLALVRWIHRWPVNSPHKGPVMRKMFPYDDVIIGKWKSASLTWTILGRSLGSEI